MMQGNIAVAEGAIDAGCRFYAGYPITPSSEIAEQLSKRLPTIGGKFIQMEDEISSMCAIIGASLTGNKVMTATSGPGFSLMQEALGYAIMAEIPCVIVNVMRGGPSTGIPTHGSQADVNQARWGTHGDHAIIAMTAFQGIIMLLLYHGFIYNKLLGVALLPFLVFLLYTRGTLGTVFFYLATAMVLGVFAMRSIRGIVFSFKKGVSGFYMILYLCALEIVPILLIYKWISSLV